MGRVSLYFFFAGCLLLLNIGKSYAQITEDVYMRDSSVDPEEKGKLYVNIDNISFFKNNEYKGNFLDGYSLPGFWLRPTAVYYPLKNIRLEAGAHGLRFWGAEKYPTFAYSDISAWKGNQFQHGFHVVPFFRAQFVLNDHWQAIIGNIYGGANHKLIEPLYNPEMNLIADPEAGFQLLYNSRKWDMDVWLHWESFIFEGDNHPEAFTVGFSSAFKYNSPQAKVHFYSPIQVLGQHRGGEIDEVSDLHMLYNGATGLTAVWNINNNKLKTIDAGVNVAAFYKQNGELVPFEKGYGLYAHASAQISGFKVKSSYWMCKDFVSLFGNPMYGSVSISEEQFYFDKPKTAYFGAEYSKSFGKGYAIGADLDIFYHFPVDTKTPQGIQKQNGATSFSFGVYVRVSPSFLIKKF